MLHGKPGIVDAITGECMVEKRRHVTPWMNQNRRMRHEGGQPPK